MNIDCVLRELKWLHLALYIILINLPQHGEWPGKGVWILQVDMRSVVPLFSILGRNVKSYIPRFKTSLFPSLWYADTSTAILAMQAFETNCKFFEDLQMINSSTECTLWFKVIDVRAKRVWLGMFPLQLLNHRNFLNIFCKTSYGEMRRGAHFYSSLI